MPDTWFKVGLYAEQLHLLIELLHILGSAEIDLVGEVVRISVDYDKLNSDQLAKVGALYDQHQFQLSIGDR